MKRAGPFGATAWTKRIRRAIESVRFGDPEGEVAELIRRVHLAEAESCVRDVGAALDELPGVPSPDVTRARGAAMRAIQARVKRYRHAS